MQYRAPCKIADLRSCASSRDAKLRAEQSHMDSEKLRYPIEGQLAPKFLNFRRQSLVEKGPSRTLADNRPCAAPPLKGDEEYILLTE